MTIWNIPELCQRTEAASKLPKGDLPEVGTVVFDGEPQVVRWTNGGCAAGTARADGWDRMVDAHWRYATPSEIDQFERDSALPEIVDPIEAEIEALTNEWIGGPSAPTVIRKAFLRGIEIERARKAGA